MKKIIFFLLYVLSIALYSEIIIEHNQPYVAYKDSILTLDIFLEGNWQEVTDFIVYYRERGEVAYEIVTVDPQSGRNGDYQVPISISQYARGLEYYIEVKTIDNQVVTYPSQQATLSPILVQVIREEIVSDFVVLNDLEDVEQDSDFSLSVSLFSLKDEIDYDSINLYINGKDQTKNLIVTPTLLVYKVEDIKESFNFRITGKKLSGQSLDSGLLKVSVKQKMFTYELPYNLRGNVNYKGNTNSFSYEDSNDRSSESSSNNHSAIFTVSGHNSYSRVNSRIYLSSLESSDRQSVNRYSFDIQVPHFDIYLGDKSPYISEFTLNSANIRGFGSKLHFKYFLLESYWGTSARSISTKEDSGQYIPGTFKRESGAVRLALGNQNAFQFGLNLAKNKDKIASLDYSDYYIAQTDTKEDQQDKQIINPVDNLVFSSDVKLSSPRKLFNFGAEFAISAYNSNIIDGAISEDELENDVGGDLPFDPQSIDGFFIINKNTEPLSLTSSNMAYKIYSSLYIAGNLFSINYSRVGSSFNSLSAKNVNTDTHELTFADNINFHNTVFVDFSYNRVSDNISENLATTNVHSNYQVNSVFRKEKLPVLRANFTKGRTSIENNDVFDINEDDPLAEIDEAQEYRSLAYGAGIGYTFDKVPYLPFSLDFDYQNSVDEDDLRDMYEFENDSYYLRYNSKMTAIPLKTQISYNFTKSTGHVAGVTSAKEDQFYYQEEEWNRSSMRLKLEYDIDYLKLVPFFDFRFSNNENIKDSDADNSYQATSFGLSYYPFRLTSLTSSISLKDRDDQANQSDYSSVNWYFNIVQKF